MKKGLKLYSCFVLSFCLVALLFPSHTFGSNPDSLLNIATSNQATKSDRIGAYADLVYHFETTDPTRALALGRDGLKIHPLNSAYDAFGVLNANIGFVYSSLQKVDTAIIYFQAAGEAFESADKQKKAAIQYKNIGVFYRKLGDYKTAIEFQIKSLKLFEEINDIDGQVTAIMNIGNVYVFQKQPELAFPYFEKALNLARIQDKPKTLAEATNSYAIGFDHLSQNDSARYYYLVAIAAYKDLKMWVKKAKAEHNVALLYLDDNDFDEAEKMLLNSLTVFNQLPEQFSVEKATIKLNLARVYMETNRAGEARQIIEEVLVTFRAYGLKTEIKSTLQTLAKLYSQLGEYDLAYTTQEEYMILKDSIQNVEITTEIAEMNERYESEKKEKEILLLQNENIAAQKSNLLILIFSIGIIAIIIIVFLVYRQMKIRELTEVKLKLKQNDRELDILREKIELETTQYLTSNQFTINREEVNGFLKEDLSERELDVFMLLTKGHTNKEIGEQLFISVSTIKFHLQKIYVKLDVNNRKDAVQMLNPRTGKAA